MLGHPKAREKEKGPRGQAESTATSGVDLLARRSEKCLPECREGGERRRFLTGSKKLMKLLRLSSRRGKKNEDPAGRSRLDAYSASLKWQHCKEIGWYKKQRRKKKKV